MNAALELLAEGLAELVAPTRCAGCDLPGALLCDACRRDLLRIDALDACPRCGAPGGARWCGECPGQTFAFEGVRCGGLFEPPLSRAVRLHKDASERRLATLLAGLAAEAAGEWARWAEAVVPVPPSPSALARRGFDHTAAIAADLAARIGVRALDALTCLPRRDQRHLSRRERAANAAGSIRAVSRVSVPSRVLVIDDVMTTGATLDAAAGALIEAGATKVRALAVARAG